MASRGKVVTFYSYKGGAGRTFILASLAVTAAIWGQRVLCIDWDLEAPGLEFFFRPFTAQTKPGLLDLIEKMQVDPLSSWPEYVTEADFSAALRGRYPYHAKLDFIAAGSTPDYATRVQALDWDVLFSDFGFGTFLERMRAELKDEYDLVFVDSRTGLSDTGGICAVQLPDILAMVLTANEQSITGSREIAQRLRLARDRLDFDRLQLPILPILSRFDGREETSLGREWRDRAARELEHAYSPWLPSADLAPIDVLELTTVPYVPLWSFGEEIPLLRERPADPLSANLIIENVAALLINGLDEVAGLISNRDAFVRQARTQAAVEASSYDIFLSAGEADSDKAAELAKALRDDGFLVVTSESVRHEARQAIAPRGTALADQIQAALQASSHLVLLVDGDPSRAQAAEAALFTTAAVGRDQGGRTLVVGMDGESQPPSRRLREFARTNWAGGSETARQVEGMLALRGQGDIGHWLTVLASRGGSLGLDDAATLSARAHLASSCLEADQVALATAVLEWTLPVTRGLGLDDPLTLGVELALAQAYLSADRAADAIELAKLALDGRTRLLGAGHPSVLAAMRVLARAELKTGQVTSAQRRLERASKAALRVLTGDSPIAAAIAADLATAYLAAGRRDKALELLSGLLAEERSYPQADPVGLDAEQALAEAFIAAGKPQDAVNVLERLLSGRRYALGPHDLAQLAVRARLSECYRSLGWAKEEVASLQQLLSDLAGPSLAAADSR